jgi:hypothetical protein
LWILFTKEPAITSKHRNVQLTAVRFCICIFLFFLWTPNIITITAETITGKSVILIDIEVKTFKTEVNVNWLRHNVFDVALTDNFQYHPYQSVRNFQITVGGLFPSSPPKEILYFLSQILHFTHIFERNKTS